MSMCGKCNQKDECKELCQAAEWYVNQDHVKLKEITVSDIVDSISSPWPGMKNLKPGDLKKIIIILDGDGLSNAEIAYHLPCDKAYISRVLTKYRDK